MSLLTLCQNAINGIPLKAPTVIVGNTEETAKLALISAQQEGKSLMRRHNWVSLQTEYTFSTAASTEDYSLPSDFNRLINETLWDRTNYTQTRGGMSPAEWQEYKSSVLSSTVTNWKRYRIRNVSGTVKFSIFPTPDAVESMVFEYISENFCTDSGGTGQNAWAADDDAGVLDEYLMELGVRWRMLSRLGMAYDEEREEYEKEVRQAIARDGGAPTLSITGRRSFSLIGPANVPDTGFGV